MGVAVNVEGSKATVKIAGKLTAQMSSSLGAAVDALPFEVFDIDIDLAGVDYVSSAGLRVLVAASKLAARRGGRLRLLHLQPSVYGLFDMAGLTNILTFRKGW